MMIHSRISRMGLLAPAVALLAFASAGPLTAASEEETGRKYHEELSKQYRVYKDARVTEIGEKVKHVTGIHDVEFFAIDMGKDDAPNAFQIPNHIYATKSLLKDFDDISLTFIMGHEMGHQAGHHLAKQNKKNQQTGLLAVLVGTIFGVRPNTAGDIAINIAGGAMVNSYSRGQENEADLFGLNVIHDLGIPFKKAAEAFQKLGGGRSENSTLNALFGSHPMMKDRIERTGSADEWLQQRPVDVYESSGRDIAVIWKHPGEDPIDQNTAKLRQEVRLEMQRRGYRPAADTQTKIWTMLSRVESLDAAGLAKVSNELGAKWLMTSTNLKFGKDNEWEGTAIDGHGGTRVKIKWKFKDAAGLADYFELAVKNISAGMFDKDGNPIKK